MAERYNIKVKVISQQGSCSIGHKVGDEYIISRTTPPGICLSAFGAFSLACRLLCLAEHFPGLEIQTLSLLLAPIQRIQ